MSKLAQEEFNKILSEAVKSKLSKEHWFDGVVCKDSYTELYDTYYTDNCTMEDAVLLVADETFFSYGPTEYEESEDEDEDDEE